MLDTTTLTRKFKFKKDGQFIELPDPNASFEAQDVIQFYSAQYPELTTCTVDGPNIDGDNVVFEFKTTVGTKG